MMTEKNKNNINNEGDQTMNTNTETHETRCGDFVNTNGQAGVVENVLNDGRVVVRLTRTEELVFTNTDDLE